MRPRPGRRWCKRSALALGLVEAGCFVAAGVSLGDAPLTAFAPIVVLAGGLVAWREPLVMAGLLMLFAFLVTPMLVAVMSGDQSTGARFCTALLTVVGIPLLAAILLWLSGGGRSPVSRA